MLRRYATCLQRNNSSTEVAVRSQKVTGETCWDFFFFKWAASLVIAGFEMKYLVVQSFDKFFLWKATFGLTLFFLLPRSVPNSWMKCTKERLCSVGPSCTVKQFFPSSSLWGWYPTTWELASLYLLNSATVHQNNCSGTQLILPTPEC